MGFKIGIDVGGTFSDFLLTDDEGNSEIYKTLTTPEDPSIGVLNGLRMMSKARNLKFSDFIKDVSIISHGTTITTNAVLTGDTAKTGLVTTKGHRDWLQTRRGLKPYCYDSKINAPEPLVPRRLRQVVEERVNYKGDVLLPLKEEDIYKVAAKFREENVDAVAVCLVFSFQNTTHEERVKQILEQELPGTYVCTSSEVLPEVRIYERGSTTVFNAAVGPVLRKYIKSALERLAESGFKGVLLIMQSNGGMMTPEVAMDFAVNSLNSGPAAGPKAGILLGERHGCKNILTVDMGGTSFDACMIRNGEPEITTELDVGMFRMAAPSIAIHSIGAGGGSIAWVDHEGMFRVGPKSAGADPGPACYDRECLFGDVNEPTVTDANVVLGYLGDYFHGAEMQIYPELARNAIKDKLCQKLGLNTEDAAYGIYKIVNTNMAQAMRVASVNKGYDPRGALMVSAGGAGPMHACAIADELEMTLILVPKISSVFCAAGMLISDIKHDFVRVAHMILLPEYLDVDLINKCFDDMKAEATKVLTQEGIAEKDIVFEYSADIRYEGQFNEITTPVTMSYITEKFEKDTLPLLHQNFNKRHNVLYGYSLEGFTQELMSLRLTAVGKVEKPKFVESPSKGKDASGAIKGQRDIYYEKSWMTVPVYDGPKMGHDNSLIGPAIIEEPTTTILVPPKWQLTCDRYDNYMLYPEGISLEYALSKIRD